jgi:hypothetical protein
MLVRGRKLAPGIKGRDYRGQATFIVCDHVRDWLAHVDEALSASQLASLRQSVKRQRPLENQTGRRRLQVYLDLRVRCVHGADPL